MSGNPFHLEKKVDRRIRRTRDRLGDALMELLVEKSFDNITVQDVLDRAEVSRSTFYSHYRDKNDLFLSDVDDFFERIAMALSHRGDKSERVAPVRELFAHIAQMRPFYDALLESSRIHDVLESGQGHFARGIEQRLVEVRSGCGVRAERRGAIAAGLAGTLMSLMSWWIHHGMTESPEEMDDLFHDIVWGGANGQGVRQRKG